MNGIPRKRLLVYAGLIFVLVGALWVRMSEDSNDSAARTVARSDAEIRVPQLQVARSLASPEGIGSRDVFRAIAKPKPAPVAAPQPVQTPQPARPDAIEIAIEQAKKAFDEVRLIGVVASGEGALAVFEYDGDTLSRVVGDQIVSGFKLERISQGEIQARHERLGLVGILSLGGVRPMQWTRIE